MLHTIIQCIKSSLVRLINIHTKWNTEALHIASAQTFVGKSLEVRTGLANKKNLKGFQKFLEFRRADKKS